MQTCATNLQNCSVGVGVACWSLASDWPVLVPRAACMRTQRVVERVALRELMCYDMFWAV